MAYSEKAKQMRRCTATRKDGEPCQAWAIWGSDKCSAHTYATRGKVTGPERYTGMRTRVEPCRCQAYAWPHRPGSGLCNWPDAPLYRSTIPAGTHGYFRTHRQRYRLLIRRWGAGI